MPPLSSPSGVGGLGGYPLGGSISSPGSPSGPKVDKEGKYWSIDRLKRSYLDYIGTKREEIDEQQDARRMRHGSQWTTEELRQLQTRRQPVVTNNKISRKIHGIVGTLARLKQDPKAYARTPKHEQGAELATAVIRYCLDEQNFDAKDPLCAEDAAVNGYGGLELNIVEGDRGDREIELEIVDVENFFYDPRSFKHDFSDARYMGMAKWLDVEAAIEMFPDKEEELKASVDDGEEMTTESDREQRWFISDGDVRRIRLVDCWYKMNGQWCWSIFTGATILQEGKSYLVDEKNETECKYIMFSAYIDQDGDRYGIVRDMKSLNREINMRRSKMLYLMLARRLVGEVGAFDDVEVARREASRADGVVLHNKGFEAEFDDNARLAEVEANRKMLEDTVTALETIGPNIAVTGEGLENSSGRAIHLLQQAGLADLGPFIQSYRGWKIRVYRAIWNAVQRHWEGERWVRVTDDDDLAEYIQINGVSIDPQTGLPTMVNAIGSLDVDIILDEGPDTVNMMADSYDTLSILAQKGAEIPPDILIELSPLPISTKKRLLEKLNPEQPSPQAQMEMANAQAEIEAKKAKAGLDQAKTMETLAGAGMPEGQQEPQGEPLDPKLLLDMKRHDEEMVFKREQLAADREDKAIDRAMKREEMAMDRAYKSEESERDRSANARLKSDEYKMESVEEFQNVFVTGFNRLEGSIDNVSAKVERVDNKVDALAGDVDELKEDVAAPSVIERDARGRAKGVRKGKRYREVKRDETGRAVSLG